jgi:hypothetical protein
MVKGTKQKKKPIEVIVVDDDSDDEDEKHPNRSYIHHSPRDDVEREQLDRYESAASRGSPESEELFLPLGEEDYDSEEMFLPSSQEPDDPEERMIAQAMLNSMRDASLMLKARRQAPREYAELTPYTEFRPRVRSPTGNYEHRWSFSDEGGAGAAAGLVLSALHGDVTSEMNGAIVYKINNVVGYDKDDVSFYFIFFPRSRRNGVEFLKMRLHKLGSEFSYPDPINTWKPFVHERGWIPSYSYVMSNGFAKIDDKYLPGYSTKKGYTIDVDPDILSDVGSPYRLWNGIPITLGSLPTGNPVLVLSHPQADTAEPSMEKPPPTVVNKKKITKPKPPRADTSPLSVKKTPTVVKKKKTKPPKPQHTDTTPVSEESLPHKRKIKRTERLGFHVKY